MDAKSGVIYGKTGLPIKNRTGAGYIRINSNGKLVGLAHRFVWESVHGDIPPGLTINHINGVKDDNRIQNLELATHSENTYHAYRSGLTSAVGERNGRARLTENDVRAIRQSPKKVSELASTYGVSETSIRAVRTGRRWSHVQPDPALTQGA